MNEAIGKIIFRNRLKLFLWSVFSFLFMALIIWFSPFDPLDFRAVSRLLFIILFFGLFCVSIKKLLRTWTQEGTEKRLEFVIRELHLRKAPELPSTAQFQSVGLNLFAYFLLSILLLLSLYAWHLYPDAAIEWVLAGIALFAIYMRDENAFTIENGVARRSPWIFGFFRSEVALISLRGYLIRASGWAGDGGVRVAWLELYDNALEKRFRVGLTVTNSHFLKNWAQQSLQDLSSDLKL